MPDRKTGIVTDSNSGFSAEEAAFYGIQVLDTPYMINGVQQSGSDVKTLIRQMKAGAAVSTSQIAPGVLMDAWDALLESFDEIVYIPISSALSGSMQTALMLSGEDRYDGKVFVVDNRRVSVTLKESVLEAHALAEAGKCGKEIKSILENASLDASIYVALPTLKYLRKGGRIGRTAAALGTILNIKPVLTIPGEKPDLFAKTRTMKKAGDIMIEAVKADIEHRFQNRLYQIHIAVSTDAETAQTWRRKVMSAFGLTNLEIDILPPALTCHIGPDAFGIAVTAVAKEAESITGALSVKVS